MLCILDNRSESCIILHKALTEILFYMGHLSNIHQHPPTSTNIRQTITAFHGSSLAIPHDNLTGFEFGSIRYFASGFADCACIDMAECSDMAVMIHNGSDR